MLFIRIETFAIERTPTCNVPDLTSDRRQKKVEEEIGPSAFYVLPEGLLLPGKLSPRKRLQLNHELHLRFQSIQLDKKKIIISQLTVCSASTVNFHLEKIFKKPITGFLLRRNFRLQDFSTSTRWQQRYHEPSPFSFFCPISLLKSYCPQYYQKNIIGMSLNT